MLGKGTSFMACLPVHIKSFFIRECLLGGEGLFGPSIVWIIPFQTNLHGLESVERVIVFQLIKVFICRISQILEFGGGSHQQNFCQGLLSYCFFPLLPSCLSYWLRLHLLGRKDFVGLLYQGRYLQGSICSQDELCHQPQCLYFMPLMWLEIDQ